MKKITFLLLFLTISYSIKAQFSEGFEDGIPNDWSVINNGSANGWVQTQIQVEVHLEELRWQVLPMVLLLMMII